MAKLNLPVYTTSDNLIRVSFPHTWTLSRAMDDFKTNQPEFKFNLVHLYPELNPNYYDYSNFLE